MGQTLSHYEVEETLEQNERLIESAEKARRLREEEAPPTTVLRRARKSLRRLARRHRTAA